jgi:predicted nucleic acid-binding protein
VIVLDASAAVELLLGTDAGSWVADRIADPAESIHAPHLLAVEVAQVLRRLVAAGDVGAARAAAALVDLADLDAERYPHEPFLPRMFALRENLTAYDAAYVALAEALDAPLLTFDRRVAAAPGHGASVELPGG